MLKDDFSSIKGSYINLFAFFKKERCSCACKLFVDKCSTYSAHGLPISWFCVH